MDIKIIILIFVPMIVVMIGKEVEEYSTGYIYNPIDSTYRIITFRENILVGFVFSSSIPKPHLAILNRTRDTNLGMFILKQYK